MAFVTSFYIYMSAKAKALRAAVKRRFHPWIVARGFEKDKSQSPYFTTFRRTRADNVDLFDIQWDKYWRPHFVINFGQGLAGQTDIAIVGRLQRRRGWPLHTWFGLHRPWLNRIKTLQWSYTNADVLEELEAAFEELEAWWRDKTVGPHVNLWSAK